MEPKKKKSKVKWIVIAVLAIIIFAAAAGGGDNDKAVKTGEVTTEKKSEGSGNKTEAKDEPTTEEAVDNVFNVGDIVETKDLKITYYSAEEYVSDNQFIQPKEGNMYYRMEFEFENISDTDQTISSMLSWNCYADGYVINESYIGDDVFDATISPGKKSRGAIYYEVPIEAKEVELEYETDFWSEKKIIFVVK